jgi:hypothetical protein
MFKLRGVEGLRPLEFGCLLRPADALTDDDIASVQRLLEEGIAMAIVRVCPVKNADVLCNISGYTLRCRKF